MELGRIVTRGQLAEDLRALGVAPGDVVMSHESVRSIGWVVGGPDQVGHAILDAVGGDGTWMKYVGAEESAYALAEWPPEVQRVYREAFPPFDPARTRACREWGVLCEYLRTWPGAVRSNHPDGSFAAVGAQAAALMAPHPLSHGLGPGGPLERFVAADGKVLLLGSPLSDVTLLHFSEYAAAVPDKRHVRYSTPMLDGEGRAVWVEIEELDSSDGIAPWQGEGDYFAAIVRAFGAAGHARVGRVGHAEAWLMRARELHAFGTAWMEANL